MRVRILTQYYDPEPATRLIGLARRLSVAGHSVEVLTAIPNFPAGTYYAGYRSRLISEEQRQDVRVVRSYVWPYHGPVTYKRLLNYGTFAASSLLGARRLGDFDVLYVYHPPLTISVPAFLMTWQNAVPFIYDVQDIWPEAGVAAGVIKPGPMVRFMTAWAHWAYKHAAGITVLSPEFVEILTEQGVPREKLSVIPNWADENIYYPRPVGDARRRLGISSEAFVVMYAGNMGSTHGVDYLLHAAQLLRDRPDIQFVFVGIGPEYQRMVVLKDQLRLENVRFLGYVQPVDMPELLMDANILLVHLRHSEAGAVSLPSRMLAYMACGRPMLVASEGAPQKLVEQAQCGITCMSENPQAIAAAVVQAAEKPKELLEMGQNGRQHYLNTYREDVVLANLVDLIERVAARAA